MPPASASVFVLRMLRVLRVLRVSVRCLRVCLWNSCYAFYAFCRGQLLHTYYPAPDFCFLVFFSMLAPVYSATHMHWFPMELKRAYSNDNCLVPLPLPWCYTAHVSWVFCVLSFFASDVASGAVVRVLRAVQHVFATPLLGRSACMVQEPCLHPYTPPHILNGCKRVGRWESGNIRRN